MSLSPIDKLVNAIQQISGNMTNSENMIIIPTVFNVQIGVDKMINNSTKYSPITICLVILLNIGSEDDESLLNLGNNLIIEFQRTVEEYLKSYNNSSILLYGNHELPRI